MRSILVAFLLIFGVCALAFWFNAPATNTMVWAEDLTGKSAPVVKAVKVQFFGDIMLDRMVAAHMGKRGLDYIFANTTNTPEFLNGAEIKIANLEGPFAKIRREVSKTIAFRFDPSLAAPLKKYGFSAFDLANNHSYDMGQANVAFTRETLKKADIGYFGDELQEGTEFTWFASQGDNKIAFIGVHNTYHEPDLVKLAGAIKDAKVKATYVIVMTHWGQEYKNISNQKQRTLAHWLVDNGASAVIGSHPHVVQEAEVYKGAPIFYSLGNFIFDQYFSKATQEGLSVILNLEGGKVTTVELKPFVSVKSQVKEMTGRPRDDFFKWFKVNSRLGNTKFENGFLTF